jgi:multidrug efflux pump subunit AcrB
MARARRHRPRAPVQQRAWPGLSSSSTRGSTNVTLQFALDRNIDAAAQDVQAAISNVVRRLPVNMPSPPSLQKVNPADQPVLFMGGNHDRPSPLND